MLFDRNDDMPNERILYKTKPNMIFGCKKAIYGFILLGIVLFVSPYIIKFIRDMDVYLISYIKLPLVTYATIAFFVVILCVILYIIWQLIAWYSIEYILTDSRIIVKSGVLFNKKTYMPYVKIQDVNTSQSIVARLFNIGSVYLFSAYDNNQVKLKNISNPSKVENIIFENMVSPRNFEPYNKGHVDRNREFYQLDDEYYDEYEPITPIGHDRDYNYQKREYEYYPEDFGYERDPVGYNQYEYEPYEDDVDYNIDKAMNNFSKPSYSSKEYYEEVRDKYAKKDISQDYPEEDVENSKSISAEQSSEAVIKRHFDKFKK